MKTAALLAAASILFTSSLLATNVLAQSAPSTNVPPPPGINDPGVQAVSPPATKAAKPAASKHAAHAASATEKPLDLKPQALPAMHDDGVAPRPRDQITPEVRVRQEGDNNIQEYRRNGRVYMVVITPKSGIAQTYMVDPQGRLVDEHGQKPVGPVMYKVLEWGKARPPAESSAPTTEDAGH
ncbi:DUF2782 domain-containing protein [Rhodanobacter ginsengiterrae]|uniref:DUF2782 domain-containing protein n=1 Tax=Rhodanobacter ginsengiterrae TaxID=2008451 RepID=UPI003CFA5336